MQWSFAIHLIGIVMWLGGLLMLTRFARIAGDPALASNPPFVKVMRKSWFIYVVQGLAITVLTGFYQLFAGAGPGFYLKQGWFHGKITLVLVLIVATAMLGFEIKNISESRPANPNRLRVIQILSVVGLVGIVLLTKVFRP